jgi:hypothetical protein
VFLVEILKKYVILYHEHENINVDERLLVGSIIWEYLVPLVVNDNFLMEEQIV